MKQTKRLLALVLMLVLALSMAACNANETETETPVDVKIMALKGPTGIGMVKLMEDASSESAQGDPRRAASRTGKTLSPVRPARARPLQRTREGAAPHCLGGFNIGWYRDESSHDRAVLFYFHSIFHKGGRNHV